MTHAKKDAEIIKLKARVKELEGQLAAYDGEALKKLGAMVKVQAAVAALKAAAEIKASSRKREP